MKIVAVSTGQLPERLTWALPFPLVFQNGPRVRYPRGSPERVQFVASQRNKVVELCLRQHPDATDILMIDTYYLSQNKAIMKLAHDYLNLQEKGILGASTWFIDDRSLFKKTRFWDTWVTPVAANAPYEITGLSRVSSVGACYIFPRTVWDSGIRYQMTPYFHGSEHIWFCRSSKLPVYMDFDSKMFHPIPDWEHAKMKTAKRIKRTLKTTGIRFKSHLPVSIDIRDRSRRLYHPGYGVGFGHERWLKDLALKPGLSFIDIGANVGIWGIEASSMFKQVHQFEPHPVTMNVLRHNISLNDVQNAKLYQCALGEEDGEISLYEYQHSGWNSTIAVHEWDLLKNMEQRSIRHVWNVPVRKLDDFRFECDQTSLMKIDTEGAEVSVLKGADATLAECHPRLVVETHSEENVSLCKEILNSHEYSVNEIWIPGQSYLLAEPS